jgi:hypothetical protein
MLKPFFRLPSLHHHLCPQKCWCPDHSEHCVLSCHHVLCRCSAPLSLRSHPYAFTWSQFLLPPFLLCQVEPPAKQATHCIIIYLHIWFFSLGFFESYLHVPFPMSNFMCFQFKKNQCLMNKDSLTRHSLPRSLGFQTLSVLQNLHHPPKTSSFCFFHF